MSHPVWVRGLKLRLRSARVRPLRSHPVWVRGLKLSRAMVKTKPLTSHPVWVRGLKQEGNQFNAEQNQVAPRVGAWIETEPW